MKEWLCSKGWVLGWWLLGMLVEGINEKKTQEERFLSHNSKFAFGEARKIEDERMSEQKQ
jgi:hypothetical protein